MSLGRVISRGKKMNLKNGLLADKTEIFTFRACPCFALWKQKQ